MLSNDLPGNQLYLTRIARFDQTVQNEACKLALPEMPPLNP
jgi:hypothetical protein